MVEQGVPISLAFYQNQVFPLHKPMTVDTLEEVLGWRHDITGLDLTDMPALLLHCQWGHKAVVQRLLQNEAVQASLEAPIDRPAGRKAPPLSTTCARCHPRATTRRCARKLLKLSCGPGPPPSPTTPRDVLRSTSCSKSGRTTWRRLWRCPSIWHISYARSYATMPVSHRHDMEFTVLDELLTRELVDPTQADEEGLTLLHTQARYGARILVSAPKAFLSSTC